MPDPRQNPPLPADDFIGRERDVIDLCRIVGGTRMVTLTGTGGMGKTRLALRVAERVLPDFPDGLRFVDLSEASSPDQVVRAVARALRVLEHGEKPPAEAVVAALRPQQVLLLLDTCERAVGPLADLCRSLLTSCPGVRILATSRQPLRVPGETVWRIPPLSLPPPPGGGRSSAATLYPVTPEQALRFEAVRLFTVRAQAARPGLEITAENAADIAEICRMLDGVPLAIELAAARARVLSVQQILRRLDDRFLLLVTAGNELPPRQRTLRAVLEWSHDLLTHPEQVLLRRLTVFGTWNLEQAETVCGHDGIRPGEVLELVSSLLDKSLIVLDTEVDGTAHYRLPDSVRAFAAERLSAAGEEETAWRRCLDALVASAEDMAAAAGTLPWEERLRYLRRLDHQREDTARLLDWALEQGRAEEGLRLCVALRPYWFVRGLFTDGSSYLRRLLAMAPPSSLDPVRARALAVHAELCLDIEGAGTAAALARSALAMARACGDSAAEAIALSALAAAALRAGEGADCEEHARRALVAAGAARDHLSAVGALGTLGRLAGRRGDTAAAAAYLTRSAEVAEEVGDRWCVARCLNGLGRLATQLGDLEGAGRRLDEALRIFAEMGVAPETARCTAALGYLDLARGDISGARRRFSGCLRAGVTSGRRGAVARSMEALAELALAEEQPERAASLAGVAAQLYTALGQPAPHATRLYDAARQDLTSDAAEKSWRAWRMIAPEQAVERALDFPTPRRALPSLLTPREKEIAALVGEGMSNRQIAEHLTISQATAARHIANIFRKLLITSRTQLAEWAGRHGIGG
ncbi:ATP-binding protein [Nocardiopsis mangrovi]|uniref:ATP-binding protein n=1 Tax=Nocardiopsis mangrovi TaxID=1179818 RepID=A0ABV9E0P9_9ACTN